jgi:lipopolysaccharide transport system permease protein
VSALVSNQWRFKRVLYASTKAELRKRYAGTLLGSLWPVLYPLLFLGAYLFVGTVVGGVRYPGTGRFDYVLFLFGGLVPFLYFMDTLTTSGAVIKQNIQLVKSVILPVDLIITRTVFVGLVGHLVGLALLVALGAANGSLTWRVWLLPIVVAIQLVWLVGIAWFVAPLGLMVPDVSHLVSLGSILLMFVSPIAFKPDSVPARFRVLLALNPITYMVDAYRWITIGPSAASVNAVFVFAALATAAFMIGAAFCWRFKSFAVDFE